MAKHNGARFDLTALRADLDSESWEIDPEDESCETRSVYLGSILSLSPSGKVYMPWACSNVMGCDTCKGSGTVIPRSYRKRTQKKHARRHARIMRRFDRLYGQSNASNALGTPSLVSPWRPSSKPAAYAFIDRQPKRFRMRHLSLGSSCAACGGSGSREAHLDEIWREEMEIDLASIGCYLTGSGGDGCDLICQESRDRETCDDHSEE